VVSSEEIQDPQKRRAVKVTVSGLLGGDESPKCVAQGRERRKSKFSAPE